jgi:hypothetical protein
VGGGGCSTKWIDEFGYITIPMLALTAFAAIGVLLAFVWSRRARGEANDRQPAPLPSQE